MDTVNRRVTLDADARKVWCKEAELLLVQRVKETKRSENWGAIANEINAGNFTYEVDEDGYVQDTGKLKVQAEHCRLYYDRQVPVKYREEYIDWKTAGGGGSNEGCCTLS